MFRTLPRHEEDALGLPYPIVLIDGAEEELNEAGEPVGVSIPDMEELVAAVALARVLDPLQLDGREVRFIRHVIGMQAKDFARALDMSPETFSRWENGKQEVGGWADMGVRMAAIIHLRERAPGLSLDTKDVTGLRIRRRAEGEWPAIEVRRIHHGAGRSDGASEAWDAPRLAAA
jgi:DNA-binding transcriptional regulator YiaG